MSKTKIIKIDSEIPLVVSKLSKKYEKTKYAIKNLSFKVEKGQFHGLIGANGAGKTTTIKSIIGAYARYDGNIKIFGKSNKTIEAKKYLGYIPETAKFPENISTKKYLSYMAYLSGYDKESADKFASDKIKELGLQKVASKSPNNFSSGQKKKVLLAQALIGDPQIIIMDEPAANLDPIARNNFFSELKKLQEAGKSILISSHILIELDYFVDSITIIDGGEIAFTGEVKSLDNKRIRQFIINFSTEKANLIFQSWLDRQNIQYYVKSSDIYVYFRTKAILYKALTYIKRRKLQIDFMKRNTLNLYQIYKHFVKKGSIATGTGKINKKKRSAHA